MADARRRILIVEDQPILGMELEQALSEAGYEPVGVAQDSRQALLLAEVRRPDLALMDINLADGRTGTSAALRLVRDLGVGVLFLTAEPELIPANFGGAAGVVLKPYRVPDVEAAVAWCLRLRDGTDPGPPPPGLRVAPNIGAPPEPDEGRP